MFCACELQQLIMMIIEFAQPLIDMAELFGTLWTGGESPQIAPVMQQRLFSLVHHVTEFLSFAPDICGLTSQTDIAHA